MAKLNRKQREKLADLFMDLAKGFFIAGFALPLITALDFVNMFKLLLSGIILAYFSIQILKETKR